MCSSDLLSILSKGKEIEKAVKEACSLRFRPIIMTSLSTMIAMLPLVIGNIGPGAGEGSRDIDIDESKYTQLIPEFEKTYFKDVYDTLSKKFKLGRVRLLLKEPRSTLSWHKDPECRLHVPIITNRGCSMVIENVAKHLPADGKVWITTTQNITTFSTVASKREFI